MKTFIRITCFVLAATCLVAAEFRDALTGYESRVDALIAGESDPAVKSYLRARLADARALDALEPGDARLPQALAALVDQRLAMAGETDAAIRRSSSAIQEHEAYSASLGRYAGEQYIGLLRLQTELLERKYFKTETAKNANFIEGLINSHWKLTRADQGDPKVILAEPTLGVHPWEAIFRLEPTLALRGGPQGAILGTGGLSYTYFPAIKRTGESVKFEENFASRFVKKSGGRLGAGAGRLDGKTRFLAGAGLQLNALGLWVLYEPRHGHWMLGLSMADLEKLKKALGIFN